MLKLSGLLYGSNYPALANPPETFKGKSVFKHIIAMSIALKWEQLPVGEIMGKIGKELTGKPYQDGTLEISSDREICSVNFDAFDCVTFFETTLAFARIIKKGRHDPLDLLQEISFIRYRGGIAGDYTTRLNYMTDWFIDNEEKKVVQLLWQLPGAETFAPKVGFMTSHPEYYRQLVAHPERVAIIKKQESMINSYSLKFIPLNKIALVEPFLKTGDITGVLTDQPGLDVVHTGLVFRDEKNIAHFMDASSSKSKMKVTIEPGPLSQSLNWSKKLTGAIFARPMEP